MGTSIIEQSLLLRTASGTVVIAGCAHPGIVKIVRKAEALLEAKPLLVLGGFHPAGKSRQDIEMIVSSFKDLGVKYVGPCHCTGNLARSVFQESYRKRCLHVGVGRVIHLSSLASSYASESSAGNASESPHATGFSSE